MRDSRGEISIVLGMLLASCGGGAARPVSSAVVERRPPESAPVVDTTSPDAAARDACDCATAVTDASAPGESDSTTAALDARSSAPTTGAFWVRRATGLAGATGRPVGPGETPTTERWGQTRCALVTIDGSSLAIELWESRALVRLRRARGGEVLVGPTLTLPSRRATIEGRCESSWEATRAELFDDRASCEATPGTFRERCHGGECEWDDVRARPFTLPGCEDELASLAARASLLESASHEASRRTLASLERAVARGGQLYERRGDGCERVAVERTRAGEALLTSSHREDEIVTTSVGRYVLEPLFGRATQVDLTSVSRARDGSPAGSGATGGPHPITLALGDGVVLLGHRTLYVRRRDCRGPSRASRRP